MAAPPGNRISSDELEEYSSWQIPEIENPDRVLQSAEREDRLRRDAAKRAKHEVVGEEVEDVAPLTAEQIKEISENAYQEGFKEGNKAGFDKGHNEGYESGKRQALEEYREILDSQSQQLEGLLAALLEPCESHTQQLQRIILDSVCQLTKAVVQRELHSDTTHVLALVKEAISYLPTGADNVKLFLNPDDVALVEDYIEERGAGWKVVPDSELLASGVRIETKQSVIDFSVESRLQTLCDQFIHGELVSDVDDDSDQNSSVDGEENNRAEPSVSRSAEASVDTASDRLQSDFVESPNGAAPSTSDESSGKQPSNSLQDSQENND
ncbi:flagellar assembly protein FliH [Aurantivibrio plasticivorans]